MSRSRRDEFEKAGAQKRRGGILGEFWGFVKENKKWWLLPLLVTLLVLALLVLLAGTGLAPFIYTLF